MVTECDQTIRFVLQQLIIGAGLDAGIAFCEGFRGEGLHIDLFKHCRGKGFPVYRVRESLVVHPSRSNFRIGFLPTVEMRNTDLVFLEISSSQFQDIGKFEIVQVGEFR